ncbi:hypothetical protein A2996_01910 [Candidatus Campbellbacteria bacterium RIFCSPLOWO2_01_FULL_34_15]|uniref:Uncharacterized protein n=2 Tax=Candidatus Campbelliibacteriota TaxID=1752727 RepID=A0A1F5EPW3_9BACT|nr:MAG: hypothetical protein A2811_00290 [Candidatus Campbellbacteria bacterium RIFCSPHIGHO2_01_FULL_34_10]OGD69437.1 MAG: hypothetical protein A2996_01910 [Candidatus Campbellbacteria bacterium RIFCSPLOWO2_01_FULL_34_15]
MTLFTITVTTDGLLSFWTGLVLMIFSVITFICSRPYRGYTRTQFENFCNILAWFFVPVFFVWIVAKAFV